MRIRVELPAGHLFRKIRNYHQIWPFASSDEWWLNPADPRPPQTGVLIPAATSIGSHIGHRYFGNRLRDSRLIGIEVELDEIRIHLNDSDVSRLAQAVDARLGNRPRPNFPFTLTFSYLNAWCAYQHNAQGHLGRIRFRLEERLSNACELHCDQVMRWEYRRFVGFFNFLLKPTSRMTVFSQDALGWSRPLHEHSLVLAIDAEEVGIQESQRRAWQRVYGESMLPIFDAFWAERDELVTPGRVQTLVDATLR